MLKMNERISITGGSYIDDQQVLGFSAEIDSANPESVRPNDYFVNEKLYEENKTQCRADRDAFEDYCYQRRDEIKAEMAAETTEA